MMYKRAGIVCAVLAVILAVPVGVLAQTTTPNIGDILSSLSPDQLSQITSALSGTTGSTGSSATSQPSTSDRIGPPSLMIGAAVAEHQQFMASVRSNFTSAASQPAASTQVKIPVTFLLKAILDIGAKYIPALQDLATFFDNLIGNSSGGSTTPPSPSPVADKGLVAYLTAAKTTLSVGGTTTVALWVQQTSPNSTNDNGVDSVALSIDASQQGIITSTVPVTLVSPWTTSLIPVLTGTLTTSGGIDGIASVQASVPPDATLGISAPIQFATWQITAKAAGTVTLTAVDFTGNGYKPGGITPVDTTSPNGDEANYVPLTITVQ